MSGRRLRNPTFLVGVALMTLVCASASPEEVTTKPAVPLDPVDGILAAFKTHQVVTLGEGGHNNEQGHALRVSLIRDPRFAKVVNDIVVEFGNSRYQDVMDRYVRGEDVPYATLRQVTQEDLRKVVRSNTVPAGIIEREVIAKGRRALVLYGDMHNVRRNTYWVMEDAAAAEERYARPVNTIVALLERSGTRCSRSGLRSAT